MPVLKKKIVTAYHQDTTFTKFSIFTQKYFFERVTKRFSGLS